MTSLQHHMQQVHATISVHITNSVQATHHRVAILNWRFCVNDYWKVNKHTIKKGVNLRVKRSSIFFVIQIYESEPCQAIFFEVATLSVQDFSVKNRQVKNDNPVIAFVCIVVGSFLLAYLTKLYGEIALCASSVLTLANENEKELEEWKIYSENVRLVDLRLCNRLSARLQWMFHQGLVNKQ